MRELRIVDKNGKRITGFGTNVFRELTGGRYVTLARRDTSRLLFEKVKGTTEVIFDNEIVGLQQSIAEDRRRDPQAASRRQSRKPFRWRTSRNLRKTSSS